MLKGFLTNMSHDHATQIAFKNCAPFFKCITKTDGTTTDDAGRLRFGHTDV